MVCVWVSGHEWHIISGLWVGYGDIELMVNVAVMVSCISGKYGVYGLISPGNCYSYFGLPGYTSLVFELTSFSYFFPL